MKKIVITTLLILLAAVPAASYGQYTLEKYDTPQKVVVTGRANNLPAGTTDLTIIFFRLGLNSETLLVPIDAEGNFRVECETYGPVTVSVRTPQILSLYLFPGDTLHAEFDGNTRDREKFNDSLTITGDRARFNRDVKAFDALFLPDPLLMDFGRIFEAMRTHTPDQFLSFLDTLQTAGDAVYDRFVETCDPSEEAKIQARSLVDLRYADFLGQYIMKFKQNTHYGKVDLPADFAEKMLRLTLTEPMLLYGASSVDTYTNRMHFEYVNPKVRAFTQNPENMLAASAASLPQPRNRNDTLALEKIKEIHGAWHDSLEMRKQVEFTPDPLLKQLVLMENLKQGMDQPRGIERFEHNRSFIDQTITLPYLREPLHELYRKTKMRIETPVIHSEAILKQLEKSSTGEMLQSLLDENKGKVVYIDVWATWCGPCKAEMPYSHKLMQELAGREVAFAYLCIESNESTWKANLDEMQMVGLQYFLTKEQSTGLRSAFGIEGIPYYLLVDRQGRVVEHGSHLRPSHPETRTKIEGLLNE